MTDIDVAALRARAIEQQAQCDKQTAIDPVVTGVWLRSRFHPVMDPAVVLELLDRLAAAEGAVDRVREVHEQDTSLLAAGAWCPACGDNEPCRTKRALG